MEQIFWRKNCLNISIPLILAGGAGNHKHLAEGLKHDAVDAVDAVATANLLNFVGDGLNRARENLLERGI